MNLTKFLLILLINISTFDFLFSQDYNWITPNKTYLKLFIADDGIHRISKADFENAGVSTSAIDPRTLKVFNRGNQIPVYVRGESDGFFNDSDYVDFYGTRN
ncbi:MAG TPA: hypothetical protein DCY06_01910, partial [Bacteroidetes bacterium]|nr:hypothetical protein [Bacteroidota bacterium]